MTGFRIYRNLNESVPERTEMRAGVGLLAPSLGTMTHEEGICSYRWSVGQIMRRRDVWHFDRL